MRTKRTETVEIEIVEFTCDDCGTTWVYTPLKPQNRNPMMICRACGKDVCRQCVVYDPEDRDADYPDTYCKSCWEKGAEYRSVSTFGEREKMTAYDRWMAACKGGDA